MWRPATPRDDDAVVNMALALYEEDPSPDPVSAEQTRRTLSTLRNQPSRGRTVVLEIAGALTGYAFLISFWSNEFGGEVCVIDELFVDRAHRGVGHGTQLIRELEAGGALRPEQIVALALETTPDNARARALYERLGFKGRNLSMRRRLT